VLVLLLQKNFEKQNKKILFGRDCYPETSYRKKIKRSDGSHFKHGI
jgi:hypothetical protein